MTYAIIGFGAVGQALATAFARKGIEVAVASRRPPEEVANMIVYACSQQASATSGAALRVDGGVVRFVA